MTTDLPATVAPPTEYPNTWDAEVIRRVSKDTVTLRLRMAPLVEFWRQPHGRAANTTARPSLADVIVTSVDGVTWQCQGVTLSAVDAQGDGVGRYFRRKAADGTWAPGTPEWVQVMAESAAVGQLGLPEHVCGTCGYAVTLAAVGEPWRHAPGADGQHPVTSVVSS